MKQASQGAKALFEPAWARGQFREMTAQTVNMVLLSINPIKLGIFAYNPSLKKRSLFKRRRNMRMIPKGCIAKAKSSGKSSANIPTIKSTLSMLLL